ncbi:MAG: ABC transporter permease [Oscillospiraceae bacterium]
MSFRKSFLLALSSIVSNKMRSFLTMLGIIIGVAAVIALVSMMNGLTGQVTDLFSDMGTTSITISVQDRGGSHTVEVDDIYKIKDKNQDLISGVSPIVNIPKATVKVGSNSITTGISGTSEDYGSIRNVVVESGRYLQYIDVQYKKKVCVIGPYIQKEFFGNFSAIGEFIKIDGESYKVVGVVEEKDDSTSGGVDEAIYIPYTNATKMLGTNKINSYVVNASNEDSVDTATATIKTALQNIVGDSDYYTVSSMKQMLDSMNTMTGTMQTMLVCIAGISLLVGGIGIMNIMLVSVTERTREIGIRKSLGAKRKDIMWQFVIEAGTVSGVGGLIGIALGSSLSNLAGRLLDLNVIPSVGAILTAFGVSVGIGIVFGFLPARNAARLNPIEALRYD